MTALADKRIRDLYKFQYLEIVIAEGEELFHQGSVSLNNVGEVVATKGDASLSAIGLALTNPEKSVVGDGVRKVSVDLQTERDGEWWDNDEDDPVTEADLGKVAYFTDDATVSINGAGRPPAGRIWGVHSTRGVLVEANSVAPSGGGLPQPELPAFAAGVSAPETIVNDGVYVVPATTANSSIVLPTAVGDGTRATFSADGTDNGHTITFKDETGNVSLNTPTTASKRFQAIAVKAGGFWTVTLTVAP